MRIAQKARRGFGRFATSCTQPVAAQIASPSAIGIETLEERVLLAVTLLIDYSLDNGFFNDPARRAAIEAVAVELGSRLADRLAPVNQPGYLIDDPTDGSLVRINLVVPADTIRVFVSGGALPGGVLAQAGPREANGRVMNPSAVPPFDFAPSAAIATFDDDGSTIWNFGEGVAPNINFKIVARHELLHALGIGLSAGWDYWTQNEATPFQGPNTVAANNGVAPAVVPGHFAQGVLSIMQPFYSNISRPTAIDWAALDDIGWDVPFPPGFYADLFGRTSAGTWMGSTNTGTLSAATPMGQWYERAGWQDVHRGDFNGDGLIDVVGRTAQGQWWVGLNFSGGFRFSQFGGWDEFANWRDVRVGDFTGDGLTDIAGRTADGHWYVGRSTGSAFITTRWAGWAPAAGWKDIRVGDFNGDGRADIAGRTRIGTWWIATSTGVSFNSTLFGGWGESFGWRDVVAADFTGDGLTDIAGRTSTGQWHVSVSTGGAFAPAQFWAGWAANAGWKDVQVADFAGDARPDILMRTSGGAWYLAISTGASFITTYFGAWTENAGWQDIQAANFSGNGKADIVARTSTGAWWVGDSSSGRLVFRPFGHWNEGQGWRDVDADRFVFTPGATGPVISASATSAGTITENSPTTATAPLLITTSNFSPIRTTPRYLGVASSADGVVIPPPDGETAVIANRADDQSSLVGASRFRATDDLYRLSDSAFGDTELLDALLAAV